MSSANSVPSTTSLSKPVPPSTETGALTLYCTSSSPPPARMSSGRAVEKPRPMIGRRGAVRVERDDVVLPLRAAAWSCARRRCCRRRRRCCPVGSCACRRVRRPRRTGSAVRLVGKLPVTGSATRLMSSHVAARVSTSALVSQTAASAKARTMKMSLSSSPVEPQLGLVRVDGELVVAGAAGRVRAERAMPGLSQPRVVAIRYRERVLRQRGRPRWSRRRACCRRSGRSGTCRCRRRRRAS